MDDKELHNLIYGKDATENVTAIEFDQDTNQITLFKSDKTFETRPHQPYILTAAPIRAREKAYSSGYAPSWSPPHDENAKRITTLPCEKLAGSQHFQFRYKAPTRQSFFELRRSCQDLGIDMWSCYNGAEAYMLESGVTLFKGLQVKDVCVLAFDIESSGLQRNETSNVFLISNYLRTVTGEVTEKLFSVDDYNGNTREMISDWCKWVRETDPCVVIGHNIIGYDLGYLQHVYGARLPLGRLDKPMVIEDYERQFRKDGSQKMPYNDCMIYGRQVIDTFFLSIKYDVTRKFPSYGLKKIIEHLGLERVDRQHYNSAHIGRNWHIEEERIKIKAYAKHDAEDAIKLYDLMIPSFFYFAQHIPKTFQQLNNSATGSQINSFLVRSYLQNSHSIPKATKTTQDVQGGISFAIPGIHRHVMKVDLKSCYPSQILRFKLHDVAKDPKAHFYHMVNFFAQERFKLKTSFKETGDKYYSDRDGSAKVFLNSSYGLCQTGGLNFNCPEIAKRITKESREIIDMSLRWASGQGKDYWMDLFKKTTGNVNNHEDQQDV